VTVAASPASAAPRTPYRYAANPASEAQAPAVTAISPSSGPRTGGTRVTITGTGLSGATAVQFGTIPATGFTVDSATQISAIAPAEVSDAMVGVSVTTPGGTSAALKADRYTYLPVADQTDVTAALSCPQTIIEGHDGTCVLTVVNAGPFTADHLTADIVLPSGLALAGCCPRCARNGSTLTWTTAALDRGATEKFIVAVHAYVRCKVKVLAAATPLTPDPNPCNNTATATITITCPHQH
jgi:hypothetical protein